MSTLTDFKSIQLILSFIMAVCYCSASMNDCRCWVSLYRRIPCRGGYYSNAGQCESAGCCYDNVTSPFTLGGSSRCFERTAVCPFPQCRVAPSERTMCRYPSIGRSWCEMRGCCFDESRQDPMCFKPIITPRTTTTPTTGIALTSYYKPMTSQVITKSGIKMTSTRSEMTYEMRPILGRVTSQAVTTTSQPDLSTSSTSDITKPGTAYYGPNGVYTFAGFTVFAQCPTLEELRKEDPKDCKGGEFNRTSCFDRFCCWKEGKCHLPSIKIIHWPRVENQTQPESRWSSWTTWTECPASSCEPVNQTRYRECLPAATNQSECIGPRDETLPCNASCDVFWSEWGSWAVCSQSCGPGVQKRARLCHKQSFLTTPIECPGGYEMAQESRKCNEDLCGSWTSWSNITCSVTCGGDVGVTERSCLEKSKQLGNPPCHLQIKVCGASPCPPSSERMGSWGVWAPWGSCSNSCGAGRRTRVRNCFVTSRLVAVGMTNPVVKSGASEPDMTYVSCKGGQQASEEEGICNEDICSSWSPWLQVTSCSASCGSGYKTVRRSCLQAGLQAPDLYCYERNIDCGSPPCPK